MTFQEWCSSWRLDERTVKARPFIVSEDGRFYMNYRTEYEANALVESKGSARYQIHTFNHENATRNRSPSSHVEHWPPELHRLFHRCWGSDYMSPEYDKKNWQRLEDMVHEIVMKAKGL